MKTTGVSCVPKFWLLVFLGHPNVDWTLGYNWKGFQIFFNQVNSEAMYCECIFRCRWQIGFSSLLHFVVNFLAWKIIQHCNKQLSNLSKCQCWLCWFLPKLLFIFARLDPKWAFGLLLIAHITQRQSQLYIIFCVPSQFGNIWGGKENRFVAEQMHTRACRYTHMLPLKKFKNESKLFQIMKHRHRRRLLHARNI